MERPTPLCPAAVSRTELRFFVDNGVAAASSLPRKESLCFRILIFSFLNQAGAVSAFYERPTSCGVAGHQPQGLGRRGTQGASRLQVPEGGDGSPGVSVHTWGT